MKKIIFFFIIAFTHSVYGQNNIQTALELWRNGDIEKAQSIADNILKYSSENDMAVLLKMKALFVSGNYMKVVKFAHKKSFLSNRPDAVNLIIDAYLHLNDYKSAADFAEAYKSERANYLKEQKKKPFKVIAAKTYIIPFVEDSAHTSDIIPLTNMYINGMAKTVMFDTGAEFLIVGKKVADELGIKCSNRGIGEHATSKTTIWHSIADSLSFVNGPTFLNVPVVIMEDSPDLMIWGTNILEKFLSTIDYPNRRFILTPRGMKSLYVEHFNMLPRALETWPFYLWGRHYMFAKGKFAGYEGLNFFFDSGLCAIADINGELKQAPFTTSKETLVKWGFKRSELENSTFFPTTDSLGISGLTQPNTLIWFDKNLEKNRSFGGVQIDGLISHAWLKNYTWTIDFDKMKYYFGIKKHSKTGSL
jgi:hypothetical protein